MGCKPLYFGGSRTSWCNTPSWAWSRLLDVLFQTISLFKKRSVLTRCLSRVGLKNKRGSERWCPKYPWDVKGCQNTFLEAPGVSLGGSGISIRGVKILRVGSIWNFFFGGVLKWMSRDGRLDQRWGRVSGLVITPIFYTIYKYSL